MFFLAEQILRTQLFLRGNTGMRSSPKVQCTAPRMVRFFATPLVLSMVMLSNAGSAYAQVLYGSLTGNVTDPSGAAIPGAQVAVRNLATGQSFQAVTNGSGNYLVQNLQPGTYEADISAAGFSVSRQASITVVENTVQRADVHLNPGAAVQTVTVSGNSSMLQTDRADVNMTLSSKQVQNLSTGTTRNFQNLYELLPGFSGAQSTHSSAGNPAGSVQFNANGISFSVNSTSIDGASDVYQWIPDLILYVPPVESIQSVNVVTADYTADQGMVGGAITNIITRSGGNDFHASAWEYHTDNALDAKPYFFSAPRLPKSILNQFGALVSGPVVKNRLFFFADWERTAAANGLSGLYTLPTDALRGGDFSGTGTTIYDPSTGNAKGSGRTAFANNAIPAARLSPAAQKLLSYVPTVSAAPNAVANDYFFSTTSPSTKDNVDAKVNYTLSEATNAFVHYSLSRSNTFDPQPFGRAGGNTLDGGLPGTASGTTQLATIGATNTFTPHLVADGTIGYSRQVIGQQSAQIGQNFGSDVLGIPGTNGPNVLQGGVPGFSLGGFSTLGDTNTNGPFSFRDNQFAIAGALHWNKGNHNFNFGTNIIHFALNHFQTSSAPFPTRGGFNFNGGNTASSGGTAPTLYNAFADFLLGLPSAMGSSYQYFNTDTVRETEYALYVEDQWQPTSKITLTYGLRYELYPYAHTAQAGGTVYDPATNNVLIGGYGSTPFNPGVDTGHGSFLPRFGVAARLNEKTVVRGGFALSVNPSNFKYLLSTYPQILSTSYNAANSFSAAGNLQTGIPAAPPKPDITTGAVPLPANFSVISYPMQFNRGSIESYDLAVERQLLPWMSLQAMYVGNNANHMNCVVDLNAGSPGLGVAGQPFYQQYGNSNNHALYEPRCVSNYNALHAQLMVRGHGLSEGGIAYAYGKAMSEATGEDSRVAYSSPSVFSRNYALNPSDLKHNLKIYGTYELPFGKGQPFAQAGLLSKVIGGWRVSNVLTYRTGTPFTVSSSGASLNAPFNTQTANQVKPKVAIYGAHAPGHHYFDPNAFAPVTTATYGNVGLYSLRGPGLFRLDTGVRRVFDITERARLEFLAQAFGLTNTPQFGNPGSTVSNAAFSGGQVTNYGGYDTITSAGGSRVLQFGLKLSY